MASGVCPDGNALQALVAGTLRSSEQAALHGHTDGCEDCQKLLAALVRTEGDESRPEATDARGVAPGTRIGRYPVDALLGIGGLGVVYAAHDPELGRPVALKLLKGDPREVAGGQARLLREAQAMARVSHPNVLTVHDVGEWEGRVFLAMELVEGGDLRAWLRTRQPSIGQIVDVFRAAGHGLAAAHAAGLIHRDFKPDNVLISSDGRVRVTDFGLARAVASGADPELSPTSAAPAEPTLLDTPLTGARAILGTPAYMAPEQHESGLVDARTDQFAFCVALYEALHGERPFAGKDHASLRAEVLAGRVRASPRNTRVPATLRRIVVRGLARRPGDRWPTMEALLAALGRDRTKVPRRVGQLSLALLAIVATAGFGDWMVRSRLYAAARASFQAAGLQVERTLELRYEAFSTLAELTTLVPILREVAGMRDQADFGLGTRAEDDQRVRAMHETLRAADWDAWSATIQRGHLAIADYKARLLYSTGNPSAAGGSVRGIPAVAELYGRDGPTAAAQIVRSDEPALVVSGIVPVARPGLFLLFARASILAGVPQATILQTIEARRFLEEISPGPTAKVALVAPDGTADGDVPVALVATGRDATETMAEVLLDGRPWLVRAHPLPGLQGRRPIGMLVVALPADVGLAGLFPHARVALFGLAGAALIVLLVCIRLTARSRH